jgi:hypothetical protein
MTDVVDIFDAFDAKRNQQTKGISEIEKWKTGGGYNLHATLTDGTVERIEGFATEGKAGRQIRNSADRSRRAPRRIFGCCYSLAPEPCRVAAQPMQPKVFSTIVAGT